MEVTDPARSFGSSFDSISASSSATMVLIIGDRKSRTGEPELEFISGKGERRGAVAVGGVLAELRQTFDADLDLAVGSFAVVFAPFDGGEDARQLVAQEDGNDGGRGFVRAQTMIVAGAGAGNAQ